VYFCVLGSGQGHLGEEEGGKEGGGLRCEGR
jgi:hypothetical protein